MPITRFEINETSTRCVFGLSVYNEHLVGGRFVSGTHSTVGRPYYQGGSDPMNESRIAHMYGLYPVESFSLIIDGVSLHNRWRWAGASSGNENGGTYGVVSLAHEILPVAVAVHTRLNGTGFIERWLEVHNLSDKPMALSHIEPLRGLLWYENDRKEHEFGVSEPFSLTTLPYVNWGYEGYMDKRALTPGTQSFESLRGRSGWGVPWFMAHNNMSGEVAVGHLEWSANWQMSFTNITPVGQNDSSMLFGMGPKARAPHRIIEPGEVIASPHAHLGLFPGGAEEAIQQTHMHVRSISRKVDESNLQIGAARIVDGELDWLENEVRLSAAQGMEYFMIDAGWYGNWEANWYNSTGDWNVTRFGNTLAAARDIIHKYGMRFCLWMELESAGNASDLRKNHPDWPLTRDGKYSDGEGRVLDLSKPEVAEFIQSAVLNVFEEHKVDGFKIDYNTCVDEHGENLRGGVPEGAAWRYVEALYALFDRVAQRFPDAVLENCAGGGGRNDLGLFRRFHTSCISDYTVLPRGIKQLNNLSMALPPERLRYYYRHYPTYHLYGGLNTQMNILMFCNPLFVGFGRDEGWFNADEAAIVTEYVRLFKGFFRPVMLDQGGCNVYHHTPALAYGNTEPWCALEYASPDKRRGYAGVFRFLPGTDIYLLRLRGIDRSRRYRVTFLSLGEAVEMDGRSLYMNGLPITLDGTLKSELVMYEAFQ